MGRGWTGGLASRTALPPRTWFRAQDQATGLVPVASWISRGGGLHRCGTAPGSHRTSLVSAPLGFSPERGHPSPRRQGPRTAGFPLRMAELLATIEGASYIARTSVDSYKNLIDAKKAVLKAFRYQMEQKGFSLVEILSPCPVDWKLSPKGSQIRIQNEIIPVYPLGIFKDAYQESA